MHQFVNEESVYGCIHEFDREDVFVERLKGNAHGSN